MSELIDSISLRSTWPSSLANMYDVVLSGIQRKHSNLSDDDCREITCTIIMELSHYFGGRDFYLPRGHKITKAIRNNEIFNLFGKYSQQELSVMFDLTQRHIHQIITQQREFRRKEILTKEQ